MTDSYDIIPVSARCVIGGSPEVINLPQGGTILDMLSSTGLQPHGLHVFIDDRLIEPWQYPIIRPMAGERVFICIVPQGGDNNKMLRSVAMIGVMILAIYAPYLAPGLAAAMGPAGGAILTAGVGIAGALAVNALIPPNTPDTPQLESDTYTSYAITGSSNRFMPFQSIPRTFGTDRVFPPYAAKPYTHVEANVQYIYMLFCLGRGRISVSDMKFGDTAIEVYQGVEWNFGSTQFPPKYFGHSTVSQSNISIMLDTDDEVIGHPGVEATIQTTDGACKEAGLEFYSPAFYFVREDGVLAPIKLELELKYSISGENDWHDFYLGPSTGYAFDERVHGFGNRLILYGYEGTSSRWAVPLKFKLGEEIYDISIRRLNVSVVPYTPIVIYGFGGEEYASVAEVYDLSGEELRDDIYLVAVKTKQQLTYSAPSDMQLVSILAKATEQLNGVPDNFNLIVTAFHPVYTASYPASFDFEYTLDGFAVGNGTTVLENTYVSVLYDPDNYVRDDRNLIIQDNNLKYVSVADTDFTFSQSGLSITGSTGYIVEIRLRQVNYFEALTNRLYWSTSGHGFTASYYMEFAVTTPGVWEEISLDMSSPTVGGTDWTSSTITGLQLEFLTVDYGEYYDIEFIRVKDATVNAWTYLKTSNPAWCYADLLTCTANHRATTLSNLDADELAAWAAACDTNGYTYNNTVSGRSLRDLMRCICAAGRAAWTIESDGKYSIIYDGAQTNIYQVFSPRNSWGFKGNKPFIKMPHALRIAFRNKDNDYDPDERTVYDDDYTSSTATLFESMEFDGINDPELIWKLGRFQFAQAQLRPENYELNVDWEGLAAERGNRIRIAHDVPMWGNAWARVKTITIDGTDVTLTIDDKVTFEAGLDYAILIRVVSGNPIAVAVVNPGASTVSTISCTLAAENSALIAVGNLLLFGESDSYYQDLIIKQVYPLDDLAARLELIDYNPDIYNVGTSTDPMEIPAYNPNITIPKNWEGLPPPVPVIDNIVSDETVLIVQENGGFITQMVVAYSMQTTLGTTPAEKIECQYRINSTGYMWKNIPEQSTNSPIIYIPNVFELVEYAVRIRLVTPYGIPSDWTTAIHTVVGKTSRPPQITSFVASIVENQVEMTWDESPARDIDQYEIRYGLETADWDTATSLGYTYATSFRMPARWVGFRQFFIKAIDTTGNESENATIDAITITAPGIMALTAEVVDNNVLFRWTNVIGTLPIAYAELRKGAVFSTAEVIGSKNGSFTTTFENTAGQYKYWLVNVDTAGNYGEEYSVTATVSEPPGYILNQLWTEDFTDGTGTNVFVMEDGRALAPVDITETWTEHFTDNSMTCFQDFIDAGYTNYVEPVPTTAEYYQEFDYGTVLSASMATMDLDRQDYNGTLAGTEYLAEKEAAVDSWNEGTDNPTYFTNFRYLRARFTFLSNGKRFTRLNQHTMKLDTKLREDTGFATITVAASGAVVTFNTNFAQIVSIIITPMMTTPASLLGIVDFTDVQNPTGFTGYLYTSDDGVVSTGTFGWLAKGY